MENVFEDYRSSKIANNDNSIGWHPLLRSPLQHGELYMGPCNMVSSVWVHVSGSWAGDLD